MHSTSWLRIGSRTTAVLLAGATACIGDAPGDQQRSDEPGDNRCAAGTICTVAGNGEAIIGGEGIPAIEASFSLPVDVAVSPDGELWTMDFNDRRLRAIDASGIIRTAADTSARYVADLLFHDGSAYFATSEPAQVWRIDLTTLEVEVHAGRGDGSSYDGDGGPAIEAGFFTLAALAVDPQGLLVILDQGNQVIRRIDGDGIIDRLAGTCVVELASCSESEPVECPDSNKLVCGDPAQGCALACSPGFAGDGASALQLRMAQPFGQAADPGGHMAYDDSGGLLFADRENHRIRRIDPSGIVTTIAGTGVPGASGDGVDATAAKLRQPSDIEVAPDGAIYFTEPANHCVRVIEAGILSTVAGQCGAESGGFAGDGGDPIEARLNLPTGIELDGDRLYIADAANHRIRMVSF